MHEAQISDRRSALSVLTRLTERLVTQKIALQQTVSEMDAELAAVRSRYEDRLASHEHSLSETISEIAAFLEEHKDTVFTEKSVKLLYGTLASRHVSGKNRLDVKALLAGARKHGVVKKLFTHVYAYELRHDAREWIKAHPEMEWLRDCLDEAPSIESITFKPDVAVVIEKLGKRSAQLSGNPIPITKLPSHD